MRWGASETIGSLIPIAFLLDQALFAKYTVIFLLHTGKGGVPSTHQKGD